MKPRMHAFNNADLSRLYIKLLINNQQKYVNAIFFLLKTLQIYLKVKLITLLFLFCKTCST